MRIPVTLTTFAFLLIACAVQTLAQDTAAGDQPKITVVGPDGKPVPDARVEVERVFWKATDAETVAAGDEGNIYFVDVVDGAGNEARTIVFVPKGSQPTVPVEMKPRADFVDGYGGAIDARRAKDDARLEAAKTQMREGIERDRKKFADGGAAIDAWARAHDLPIMDLEQVRRAIKKAEKLPAGLKDARQLTRLKAYEQHLKLKDGWQEIFQDYEAKLKEFEPTEKKVVTAPGACPEGQSGGLLAGLLNSVTGTNSFTGICGEDPDKDNKDRKQVERDKHKED